MIITRIFIAGSRDPVGEAEITAKGLRGRDDLVTVTDEAALAYCSKEGRGGLCTAKFNADLIVDHLEDVAREAELTLGEAVLQNTDRRKHCHAGCDLDPSQCLINDRVLFFKVRKPGRVRTGEELIARN